MRVPRLMTAARNAGRRSPLGRVLGPRCGAATPSVPRPCRPSRRLRRLPRNRPRARRQRRGRGLSVSVLATAAALLVAAGSLAAPSKRVVVGDPADDVSGPLDLRRASLQLAPDGRLRAVITLAGKVDPKAMLAGSGPPGSVCLKVWTAPDVDTSAERADRLVCVTARNDAELRASVFEQREAGLPQRLQSASVRISGSRRSLVLRISQSSLGRPELIRFAVESTQPSCARVSCIDALPDKGRVRRFRLHGSP
ncbi:MAG TPA: hypothetical protein VGO80_18755 [Solirubrobacteraceae bacterium]|nr:hypothetical protein [Solirubrobacteraceae bacterium]